MIRTADAGPQGPGSSRIEDRSETYFFFLVAFFAAFLAGFFAAFLVAISASSMASGPIARCVRRDVLLSQPQLQPLVEPQFPHL